MPDQGRLSTNPGNGTVLILLVVSVDVFFGPAIGWADRLVTRGRRRPSSRCDWSAYRPAMAGGSATAAGVGLDDRRPVVGGGVVTATIRLAPPVTSGTTPGSVGDQVWRVGGRAG